MDVMFYRNRRVFESEDNKIDYLEQRKKIEADAEKAGMDVVDYLDSLVSKSGQS